MTSVRTIHQPRPPSANVLVLSPDPSVAASVIRPLREGGLRVESVIGAEEVRRRFDDEDATVAVVDLELGADAVELVRDPSLAPRIVLLSSLGHRQTAARLTRLGAAGYILEPVIPAEAMTQVERAIEGTEARARQRARSAARSATSARTDRQIAHLLAAALRHRDGETSAHMMRVGQSAEILARTLGWSEGEPETFRLAAGLHDLGKIGLPDAVLDKPGRLTPDEFRVVTRHPRIGAAIIDAATESEGRTPLLHTARTICLYHHERWDGGGYPEGLSRQTIPWEARVVAVVDVYDALLQTRPYREAVPEAVALAYIQFQRCRRFDPEVVDAFLAILPEIREIREAQPEGSVSPGLRAIAGRSP